MKYGEKEINEAFLETWENPSPEREYTVDISMPEFTCLCPRSGYPDFATINISYVPGSKVLELRSFKLYLNKFRSVSISHEAVVNKVFSDIERVLEPVFMEITGDFNPRGNVKTVIKVSTEGSGNR